ncbi:MAG: STAS domain-containing protein [Acidobacteriota bacterium]|nr:STAS domain-containing protein [Blastocatellia bacterium]MDW8413150.1 STAS domain-containing protein [Acidobacteriota bacterium]
MNISERQIEDVTILDLEGKILLGDGDVQLKQYVADLIARGVRRVLLNCKDVPYMDSSGLGEVVRCYTAVKRAGGELKLVNLSKRLVYLLTITKLITVFETFDSEEAAIRSFK